MYIQPLWILLHIILIILLTPQLTSAEVGKASKFNLSSTYKVFRIYPKTWKDVESLEELRSVADSSEIDFWLDSRQPNQFSDLMISPSALTRFKKFMSTHGLVYKETISNVEKLIYKNEFVPELEYQQKQQEHIKDILINRRSNFYNKNNVFNYVNSHNGTDTINKTEFNSFLRRLRDEDANSAEFDEDNKQTFERIAKLRASYPFGMYTNYAAMLRYMRTLDFYYPHIVKLIQLGKTHEGRSIEGLKIGYHVNNITKRVFWIDGNIHAREWASSHTALFIINQLVSGYGKNSEITHYLNSLNFIIVPCANPDGFEYSRSSLNPQIRLWRKNRSPEKCANTLWGGYRCCQGVDLNRNFDFHWAETGSSLNPCSNLYAGTNAFSEPETKAVADFLGSDELLNRVDGFITLHTYAQMWIHPYSHEVQNYPKDLSRIKNIAEKATERLRKIYGTKYQVGTGADLLAPASGGSDDWAKDKLGVKYVYLVELRPQLELSKGFILRQEELIPTAIETFEGIKIVIDSVLEENNLLKRKDSLKKAHQSPFLLRSAPSISRNNLLTSTLKSISPQDTIVRNKGFNSILHAIVDKDLLTSNQTSPPISQKNSAINTFLNLKNQSLSKIHPLLYGIKTNDESNNAFERGRLRDINNAVLTIEEQTQPKFNLSASKEIDFGDEKPALEKKNSTAHVIHPTITITTKTAGFTDKQTDEVAWITESSTDQTQPTVLTHSTTVKIAEFLQTSTTTLATIMQQAIKTSLPQTNTQMKTASGRQNVILNELAVPVTKMSMQKSSHRFLTSTPVITNVIKAEKAFVISIHQNADINQNNTNNAQQLKTILPTIQQDNNQDENLNLCVNRKYSCVFWIKAHPSVCYEQRNFMITNCAFSCGFCQ